MKNCARCNRELTAEILKRRYKTKDGTQYYGVDCRLCYNEIKRKPQTFFFPKTVTLYAAHKDPLKLRVILRNNVEVLIDKADHALVSDFNWAIMPASKKTNKVPHDYAVMINSKKNGKIIKMHRFIIGVTDSNVKVDHIDGDSLNNCRSNLRVATNQQNSFNSSKPNTKRPPSSAFKGVCWDKARDKWHVGIKHNYKKINIGRFDSEIKAAQAYDERAKELFGEFAKLNFPK
jgi:hypothetical protein